MSPEKPSMEGQMCQPGGQSTPLSDSSQATIETSNLPALDERLESIPGRGSVGFAFDNIERLYDVSSHLVSSPGQMLEVVWGLVLRCYSSNDCVYFGLQDGVRTDQPDGDWTRPRRYTLSATDTLMTIHDRVKACCPGNPREQRGTPSDVPNGLMQPFIDTVVVKRTRDLVTGPLQLVRRDHFETYQSTIIVAVDCNDDTVDIDFSYLLSKLSLVAVKNVAETFRTIVGSILADPYQSIGELDMVSARDLQQIFTWNSNVVKRCDSCVHHFIEDHALHNPEAPAVQSHDGSFTYRELDDLATRIAKKLTTLGITSEILVPVCFEKSVWAVIAMVAILKAGGAFVPLDPSHPIERLAAIIQKTKASVIITSATHSGLFEGIIERVYVVGPTLIDSCDEKDDDIPLVGRAQPENAAFVLFTSGSTGQPKGIIQDHGSVCTNSLVHGEALGVDSASRVLQFAAYTFDVSMMDIFTTLILGGCVCIPSEYDRTNDIVNFINRMNVNWALLTPSFSNLIHPEDVPSLRTLVLGGEAVTQENIDRWAKKVVLLNCYGPAEAGTCIVSETQIVQDSRAEVIGRRLSGGLCWLTDPSNHHNLVPVGAIGELCVEGPTLARGYLDNPALTAAHFVENPHWLRAESKQNRRIYKTGDLLRQNTNGSFAFVGRVDSQVKIRGQRVELGEVEHRLLSHPAVAACVIASPQTGPYFKCLVGVVQLHGHSKSPTVSLPASSNNSGIRIIHPDDAALIISQFAQHMQEQLPPYMIPNAWVFVDRIPFSTSAKMDRKKVISWLTTLDRDISISQVDRTTGVALQTVLAPQENTAIDISQKVAAMIAPRDKHLRSNIEQHNVIFSEIGLDSIQAISLAMSIRKTYGVKLPIEYLTHRGTSVRDIAKRVDEYSRSDQNVVPGLRRVDVRNEWQKLSQQLRHHVISKSSKGLTVFLTGATGFLGTQILSKLFAQSGVQKIIAHIRADSIETALKRIAEAASCAPWWSESLLPRLEIWLGDLEQPRIGLTPSQWDRIIGKTPLGKEIDVIIHNGASVRWNADFETLQAANVGSTMELLKAVLDSPCPPKLVYISGGQALTPFDESDEQVLNNVALSNGYCQTKTVSELLVKDLMRDTQSTPKLSIVKPSYVIGSSRSGVANTTDFLWRLVGSCIDIQAYNAADEDRWLYISDVDRVASIIVDDCWASRGMISKVLDGLPVRDFWKILTQDFEYDIKPLPQETWLEEIRKDIERKGERHRLWPLLDTLEEGKGRIGESEAGLESQSKDDTRLKDAIRKNIEYLVDINFFPRPVQKVSASPSFENEHPRKKQIISNEGITGKDIVEIVA